MGAMINGKTPEEIKRGLYAHSQETLDCKECPYDGESRMDCSELMCLNALTLIRHLESERDAALAKVPKWISVEERLPWMNQKVLVSDGSIVTEAHYNGRGEWIHNGHDMELGGVIVTHWMPLPEPKENE